MKQTQVAQLINNPVARRIRRAALLMAFFLVGLCTVAAAGPKTEPQVQVTPKENGYLITTPAYRARLGADGNLHSLIVNGVEFLDDRVTGFAGASFIVDRPIQLPTLTVAGRTVTATDGAYSIVYRFEEGFIGLTLRQNNPKGAAFVVICAPTDAYIEQVGVVGGMAAVPVEYEWSNVKISTPTGEYLEFLGGSRVWGRAIGRQALERSIPPNKEQNVTLLVNQGPPSIPHPVQLTTLTATVSDADALIAQGQNADLQVRLENNGNQPISAEIAVRVESSLGAIVQQEQKPFNCDGHQSVTLSWPLALKGSDFYTVTASYDLNGATKRASTTFGYDVDSILPTLQRPADFQDYWNRVMLEAKTPEVKLNRLEDRTRSTGSVTVYRISMQVEGATCFGWLAVPKFPGKYPGLLILPSDRVQIISPNAALANNGFVAMTVEPTGQSVDGAIKPLVTQSSLNMHDPATFGLRGMMIRQVQSVTALSSVPEVDPHRIAVTGVGLGGGMAMMLGAIDERVQAVAPDVPDHCLIDYGRNTASWPYREVTAYLKDNPKQADSVMKTLSYYDVANFAENLTCPVMISAGINDPYARPTNIFGVYNRIAGPKSIRLYLAGHEGGGAKHWEEKIKWLSKSLGEPIPLPVPPIGPAPGKGDNALPKELTGEAKP